MQYFLMPRFLTHKAIEFTYFWSYYRSLCITSVMYDSCRLNGRGSDTECIAFSWHRTVRRK